MKTSYWLWYPGDFELYHAMKQNFSRVERGYGWPAFWKSEGFRQNVYFKRTYELTEETSFQVESDAVGYVLADGRKYPFGSRILCGPGNAEIVIHAAKIETFPSVYIAGDVICSDEGWLAGDYEHPLSPAGFSRYYTGPLQNPAVWEYSESVLKAAAREEVNGGVLFSFENEMMGAVRVILNNSPEGKQPDGSVSSNRFPRIYCGESREEALDTLHCYTSWQPDALTGRCPPCALRFVFIPGAVGEVQIEVLRQSMEFDYEAACPAHDETLRRIWEVAEHTFLLCSGIFFIDGIKRDRWIWAGDAYQSILINEYLMRDPDINRRTLLALRGNDRMTSHINTILDYSLLWVLSVDAHRRAYGDEPFLRQVFPKLLSLMEYVGKQIRSDGFIIAGPGDWVFIDWADFDKTGAFAPEQMLLAASYQAMAEICRCLGISAAEWEAKAFEMREKIRSCFWDEEKNAYLDSYESGQRHVSRHANIFAILFGIAGEEQKEKILRHVLHNPEVPAIRTPYFRFFELEALCRMGCFEEVLGEIRSYWGGMLARGAVTFWEEFDPDIPEDEQYDMYGDRFGKSLCHAWGAGPVYFLGKYQEFFRHCEGF